MLLEPLGHGMGERLLRGRSEQGLTVLLNPRPDYARTFAVMCTRFGSLDHTLDPGGGRAPERVPDGVAHFLEHKLFEDEEGDVSMRFSARGANVNAATEFTRTSYHFSCTDHFLENLETLVRFVQEPYFTAETVHKEQGIIEQEIRMYDDDPDWRVFFQMLEAMYHEHPVRINIAGTVESIRAITPDVLYRCHEVFYHPRNMVLAVSGRFDEREVAELLDRTLPAAAGNGTAQLRPAVAEPDSVRAARAEIEFPVSRPQVCFGFKDVTEVCTPRESFRRDLAARLLLDLLFSQSSPYHEDLYNRGVIDDTFDASYSGEEDFGFTAFGAECDNPDQFRDAVLDVLARARRDGLSDDDFARHRNRFLGRFIRTFNSVEATAGTLVACHWKDVDVGELVDMVGSLAKPELEERLRHGFDPDRTSLSILWPRGGEG